MNCLLKQNNPLDWFAIKTVKRNSLTVGYLPKEISRIMKFFNKRGAKVSVQLTFSHYHKSPLVQGGLEVGCELTTGMPLTARNHILVVKYLVFGKDLYTEPKEKSR